MTSNAAAGDRILGSLRSAEGKGIVRVEERFDTDVDDLWSALTEPGRLAHWIGEAEGDLRLGGEFRFRFFASGSEGAGRVEACEPPRRLLLTMALGQPDEDVIEATLAADGDQTILVWEERGMPRTSSPPTGPGCRSTSKILLATWPGANAAMQPPGSTICSLPTDSWPSPTAGTAQQTQPDAGLRECAVAA